MLGTHSDCPTKNEFKTKVNEMKEYCSPNRPPIFFQERLMQTPYTYRDPTLSLWQSAVAQVQRNR